MNRTGFDELITSIKQQAPKRVAVVAAADNHTLEALLMAQRDGLVTPILIGDAARVAMCLEELGCPAADACIVDAASQRTPSAVPWS